jgi:hypothetical protein
MRGFCYRLGVVRRFILVVVVTLVVGCSGGRDRRGAGGPYEYEPYGPARVDPGALYRHQARERAALEREQEGERRELLRRQRRERQEQKSAGEWDAAEKREQRRERQRQERRFDRQERRLFEHQQLERDRYD